MKILIKQFLGKNHSWSCFGWGIATALIQQGHQVHLFSTDGIAHLPSHLLPYVIGYVEENETQLYGRLPDTNYDSQISYTCMRNFPYYLSSGSKSRFGIWCFEWDGKNVLPDAFAKNYKACDALCAPSNFAKEVFIHSGIPDSAITVIPHGINTNDYRKTTTIALPTTKRYKILANIAQLHLRKNIPGLLKAYGEAFNSEDDVCLILKTKEKIPTMAFEVSLSECLREFNKNYPKHAEVKIFSEFIQDMSALYRSVDTVYTMSHCECFYFPGLEGLAAGRLSIAPRHGGQLDFLNDQNSLLVEGQIGRANPKSIYWQAKPNAEWFVPSVDSAIKQLKEGYLHFEELNVEIQKQRQSIYDQYDWKVIASQFVSLCR